MALSGEGDRIEGDKIAFFFGRVVIANDGARRRVTLALNGEAVVLKPLKRASIATSSPKEYPRIRCQAARGEADKASKEEAKVHYGSHRCFEGRLVGDAWCEVTHASSRE